MNPKRRINKATICEQEQRRQGGGRILGRKRSLRTNPPIAESSTHTLNHRGKNSDDSPHSAFYLLHSAFASY